MLRSRQKSRGIHHLDSSRVPLRRNRKRASQKGTRNGSLLSPVVIGSGVVSMLIVICLITFTDVFSRKPKSFKHVSKSGDVTGKYLRNMEKYSSQQLFDKIQTEKLGHHRSLDKSLIGGKSFERPQNSIYSLSLPTINTKDGFFSLSQLTGRLAVVINVACA